MNTSIVELKEVLVSFNVTVIDEGIKVLNTYFDSFQYHELKSEWDSMNKTEKRKFVKQLMYTRLTDENQVDESQIESDIDDNENSFVTDIDDSHEDLTVSDVVVTEFSQIKQNEIDGLLEQIEQYKKHIVENEQRLVDLGYKVVSTESKSKVQLVKEYFELNPKVSRKDFMEHFVDLGSKALLSTYFQSHRPK